ncbi:ATP-binding protein [Phytohabitans suffuscus]|uniref:histidine kinase n=1 Tax=Phytohabitans suffuscus TaxID=624315 RepID=A0A6F8YUU1_9ACTN|nr:ATP-binding protein [Phytohabitans suffuscus]BCB89945.1 hypothetical protein Psuf_072580 [Phytohabitans suffuscus]
MRQLTWRRPRALTVLAVAGTAAVVAVFAAMVLRGRPAEAMYGLYLFQNGPSGVVLLWMGRLILLRQPGNTAGRVLVVVGAIHVLHVLVMIAADVALVSAGFPQPLGDLAQLIVPADLPLTAAVPLWVANWLWLPAPLLAATVLLLAFPDGTPRGRATRPVLAATAVGGAALMAAFVVDAWPTADWPTQEPPAVVLILLATGGPLVAAAVATSVAVLLIRWRQARGPGRRPFQVAGMAAVAFAVVAVATYPWQHIWTPAILVSFNLLIVAYALAVARYRLHDLEPVLGRAAVAATMSLLVAAVYATVVIGAASLVGQRVDSRVLPLVAIAFVAVLVEPARRRTRTVVDRLLFHRRTDRTEVMSRLAAHANVAPASDVVTEVTDLLVRSTGAARAEVHLTHEAAAELPAAEPPVLRTTVQHHGETFGEVRLYATARADLVPDAAQLLDDVAHTLGVVLHNERLTTQLRDQLDELHASRRRLVEAHEHARRGLERDIHDGAQARLISLRLRLGALRARLGHHGDQSVSNELGLIGDDIEATIRSLRALARGLHPPLLEQAGLTDALRSHARDLPIPVTVTADSIGRYPRAVEAATYFACLEAVQNAIRHSQATTVTITLAGGDGQLHFQIQDDGTGFDPTTARAGTGLVNIHDRLSALGGQTRVYASLGKGTRVTGRIPVEAR